MILCRFIICSASVPIIATQNWNAYIRLMFLRLVRQIGVLALVLGVFLSGAMPAFAMSASIRNTSSMTTTMSDMAMDASCMESGKAMPGKKAPCKSSDSSCAICTSCAVHVALVQDLVPVLYQWRNGALIGADVNSESVAPPPALPPPILRA